VSETAAKANGLMAGTPVVTGSSDGTTAMYGSGILDKHTAVLVSGTTDVLMAATAAAVEDPDQVLSVNTAMLPGHYLAGGAMGMSGGAVAQFEDLFDTVLDRHASAIAALRPGCDGLMVLPGISGERAPYWLEDVGGGVLGLRTEHRIEHILRATMESTAYRSAELLDIMHRSGIRVDKVRVVGGTARNDNWNQIRSDVWGKAVEKPNVEEATLLGAAMFCCSALEPGRGLKDIAREWITVEKRFTPDVKAHAAYARLSGLFSRFVRQNAGFFKALSQTA
jgi:sugar (pentulose or hexulose) kinase